MNQTAQDIYKSILYRAADIYEVEYEDVERDVGQQFDPIIRFMSGALASELERVYQHINDTESRLQKRLAKVLLPEYFHLPQPAHGLAKAKASADSFMISEVTSFRVETEDEEKADIALTPVFPSRILPAEVKLIATKTQIINLEKRKRFSRKNQNTNTSEVRSILLGIESAEPLTNWEGVNLYFNLRGTKEDSKERELFFAAIPNTKCTFHKHRLVNHKGLAQSEVILEDYLNGNERYERNIRAKYEHHFLTFSDKEIQEEELVLAESYFPNWFSEEAMADPNLRKQIEDTVATNDKPLYWLELQLSKPVEITQIDARLDVRLNVFPVANRKLNGEEKGGHYYLRDNSIKWVSLNPEEDFISIRRVYEEKSPEYPVFTFKPFADFKEDRKPSYTLRHGGVGRWDDFNAWKRLAYVVSILQDNYKHEELIEQAAGALSLEDVHHLLGNKISKTAHAENPARDIYVLLHAGIERGIRVRVEYWTSIGEEANNLAAKSTLFCESKEKASFEKDSIELFTSTIDGKSPLNSTEQLNAMKSALLSRGRIVTREDVKVFCKTFLTDKLAEVKVKDGVGVDQRFDFGMTRLLEVQLKASASSKKEDWEGICRQVQKLLEQNSTSSIPIKVIMQREEIAV